MQLQNPGPWALAVDDLWSKRSILFIVLLFLFVLVYVQGRPCTLSVLLMLSLDNCGVTEVRVHHWVPNGWVALWQWLPLGTHDAPRFLTGGFQRRAGSLSHEYLEQVLIGD
jgi:hypothetical protein